ncbi:hypothetical protein MUU74_16505 [Chryseobacterium daecheongense]|uniref:hypothetical protein n=1 Tax=Chryseobacterium daecheongense TaxID=192389 RepID=UPI001FD6FECB|nr:hypothetical protein [Chryseobacterium daecheongense]UOU98083.1 hypothetical protein MUU74_16505 [Chryseobacterium daecheongense]
MGQVTQKNQNLKSVEFIEVRRLNYAIDIKEYSIVNSTKDLKMLYQKLNDSRYSKSAPIPVLEKNEEIFVVLKPKLKKIKYGDIEVEKLATDGSTLFITYKEIENLEYAEKKQTNPIVILKVFNNLKRIKLTLNK